LVAVPQTAGGDVKYLVYGGKTGWLGQQLVALLKAEGTPVIAGDARIENREDVARYSVGWCKWCPRLSLTIVAAQ